METLGEYISIFTGMVGCYSHKCKDDRYSSKIAFCPISREATEHGKIVCYKGGQES